MRKRAAKIFLLSVLTAVLAAFPASKTAAFRIRAEWSSGAKYLYLRDIAMYYGLGLRVAKTCCELSGKDIRLRLIFDKRQAWYNGTLINTLRSPYLSGREPMVSEQDFLNLIEPLLRSSSLRRHRLQTIVLDPGHGGHDNGAETRRVREKDIALTLCYKIRDKLRRLGYQVVLTRSKDVFVPLEARPAVCGSPRRPGDLFISIHCNAAARDVSGIETYAMAPVGVISSNGGKPDTRRYPGNAFDRNSARLAYEVQRYLTRNTKAEDRGVKHSRFAVLRLCPRPAILVETGFLSSPREERALTTGAYQDVIANSIASGVLSYHRAISAGK